MDLDSSSVCESGLQRTTNFVACPLVKFEGGRECTQLAEDYSSYSVSRMKEN